MHAKEKLIVPDNLKLFFNPPINHIIKLTIRGNLADKLFKEVIGNIKSKGFKENDLVAWDDYVFNLNFSSDKFQYGFEYIYVKNPIDKQTNLTTLSGEKLLCIPISEIITLL